MPELSKPSEPVQGTFAFDAREGIYYEVQCDACGRRQANLAARSVVAMGFGAHQVVGCQPRLRCTSCKVRGRASLTIRGYWTGHGYNRPADWAETVEERMRR